MRVRALALAWGLALACAAPRGERGGVEQRPYNVLFIAVDDLRPELGCYGAAHARSPAIDGFAATAMLFENHFVEAPSCGPSRYALLTGRSAASVGALGNDGLHRGRAALKTTQGGGVQTFPELFRRGGYRTVCIGKISHTPDGRVFAYDGSGDGRPELPGAWDELATPFGPWKRGWGAFFAYAGGAHREDGGGHDARSEFVAARDDDLPDGLMARAASERLKGLAAAGEPFFLGVGFFKPHLPFVAPARDLDALADVDVPLPPVRERVRSPYLPGSGEFRRYTSADAGALPATDEEVRRARREYLACVRYMDRQVGRVLGALEDAGLADSTIVVLWGDHGWHLGDSGVWGKHTVLERSLRSPLLIRVPGVTGRGTRTAELASTVDLYPTLAEVCGLEPEGLAAPLDGVSLVPLLRGQDGPVREACTSYHGKRASLRTRDVRLVARRVDGAWRDVRAWEVAEGADPPGPVLAGDAPSRVDARRIDALLRMLPPAAGQD